MEALGETQRVFQDGQEYDMERNIDPEFLEWAYAAHQGASIFAESNLSLADIENMPFQMMVDGRPITIV
jgi:hypothetical protein